MRRKYVLIMLGLVLLAFMSMECFADMDQCEEEYNILNSEDAFRFEYDPNTEYETVDDMLKVEPYRLYCSQKRLTGEVERKLDLGYGFQTMKCKTGYAVYSLTNERLCYMFFEERFNSSVGYVSTAIVEYPSEEFEEYRHMIYECDWPEKMLEND